MGRGNTISASGGVELRETSIRILFSYQSKQRKETLYLDNAPLPPTPANAKYARRVANEIRSKIKDGTFVYAEYFPHSKNAVAPVKTDAPMLFDVMDQWIKLLDLKASTKKQYTTRIGSFWKFHLKNGPIRDVKHSDILTALQKGTWKSGKSRNNELSMIKQMFDFARKDKIISENPCDEIDRAGYQRPPPDPFSLSETTTILASIREHYHEQIHNYTQFVFFTGLRTSEAIALRWANVDLEKKEVSIEGVNVYDEESDSTKTNTSRTVRLNSMAFAAMERQKAHTLDAGGIVFKDPKTGEPWAYSKITDVRGYWGTTLKRTKIRPRRPYNMRHTYATVGLMSGAKPGFLAKQLGHSLRMFFDVYADWINSDDDDREMAKIEEALSRFSPELTPEQN
jgi:integrase